MVIMGEPLDLCEEACKGLSKFLQYCVSCGGISRSSRVGDAGKSDEVEVGGQVQVGGGVETPRPPLNRKKNPTTPEQYQKSINEKKQEMQTIKAEQRTLRQKTTMSSSQELQARIEMQKRIERIEEEIEELERMKATVQDMRRSQQPQALQMLRF